jgi:cytidine deaminase
VTNPEIPSEVLSRMESHAWVARKSARVLGKTQVGCAVLDNTQRIYPGCNIEHRFRSHDIHAEISAMSSMVTAGGERLVAILIAAERNRFTPCGACLDWIFELGGAECQVFVQGSPETRPSHYTAGQLMPHYPE